MSLRNITGGQIVIGSGLIFVGAAMIFATIEMAKLTNKANELAPAVNSIGSFFSPRGQSASEEVPVDDNLRSEKVQSLTTIEVVDMRDLTQAEHNEIKRLNALNFTTSAIWKTKNKELMILQAELDRRLEKQTRQQAAIDNPTEDRDVSKMKLGLATMSRGIAAQHEIVEKKRTEMSTLQNTLDTRTKRIKKIMERQ